jgi:hypothetical protein
MAVWLGVIKVKRPMRMHVQVEDSFAKAKWMAAAGMSWQQVKEAMEADRRALEKKEVEVEVAHGG